MTTKIGGEVKRILENVKNTLREKTKNEEEYQTLLERKKAGEPVEYQINQNRYRAEIIAKKDKVNIDEIYNITAILGYEMTKNEEIYETLLVRKKKGEYIDDLIKQNRYTAQLLHKQNNKVFSLIEGSQELTAKLDVKRAELQRELQARKQILKFSDENIEILENSLKAEGEYDLLLEREKGGESVRELIKKNRRLMEELRRDFKKNIDNAKEWLKMNPDMFQDPVEKRALLIAFRLFPEKNEKQLKKEEKKRKRQKCPICKTVMEHRGDIDGYQCSKCKKKYYYFEYKLREL